MNTMTERIRAARKKAGLSQTEVAKALRISPSAVDQWEHGFTKNIKLEHFFTLAHLLEQDPQWLATGRPLPQAREAAASDSLASTSEERALLYYVRQMPDVLRKGVLRFVKILTDCCSSHDQLNQ